MISINAFLSTLPIMAKGMLGIFAVTVVIVICMKLLNRISDTNNE